MCFTALRLSLHSTATGLSRKKVQNFGAARTFAISGVRGRPRQIWKALDEIYSVTWPDFRIGHFENRIWRFCGFPLKCKELHAFQIFLNKVLFMIVFLEIIANAGRANKKYTVMKIIFSTYVALSVSFSRLLVWTTKNSWHDRVLRNMTNTSIYDVGGVRRSLDGPKSSIFAGACTCT